MRPEGYDFIRKGRDSENEISLCKYNIKGTTRGLSGVFLPLVMNPLCPLK